MRHARRGSWRTASGRARRSRSSAQHRDAFATALRSGRRAERGTRRAERRGAAADRSGHMDRQVLASLEGDAHAHYHPRGGGRVELRLSREAMSDFWLPVAIGCSRAPASPRGRCLRAPNRPRVPSVIDRSDRRHGKEVEQDRRSATPTTPASSSRLRAHALEARPDE